MPSQKGRKHESALEILYLSKAVAIFLAFVQWISFIYVFIYLFIWLVSYFCFFLELDLDFAVLGIQAKALHLLGN